MKYALLGVLVFLGIVHSRIEIESRVYTVDELRNQGISGETVHLSDIRFQLKTLHVLETSTIQSKTSETLVIVKDGEMKVDLGNKDYTIGPGSVMLVLAEDVAEIEAASDAVEYYEMSYESKKNNSSVESDQFESRIIDFDELEYHEHDRGGIREYFNFSTPNLSYFEMHVTNLNGNIKSHEPHTHGAAEFVLMVKGHTEMEIGDDIYEGNPGDLYFLESEVPHAIKNLEDQQCMYFAFQWES